MHNFSSYPHNETKELIPEQWLIFCIQRYRIKIEFVFSEFVLLFAYLAKHNPNFHWRKP